MSDPELRAVILMFARVARASIFGDHHPGKLVLRGRPEKPLKKIQLCVPIKWTAWFNGPTLCDRSSDDQSEINITGKLAAGPVVSVELTSMDVESTRHNTEIHDHGQLPIDRTSEYLVQFLPESGRLWLITLMKVERLNAQHRPQHSPLCVMQDITDNMLDDLISTAKAISRCAYSPYSNFQVGAAILSSEGKVYSGCNVENASYGLTICAERNAIFQMVADGKQQIKAVVIYTPTTAPAAPCGACRQVINEFGPQARIVSVCDGPERLDATLEELLPGAFGPGNLGSSAHEH